MRDQSSWLVLVAVLVQWVAVGSSGFASTLKTVVDHGPPESVVDLVFLAEGYTANEEERFHDDVARLVRDTFGAPTAVDGDKLLRGGGGGDGPVSSGGGVAAFASMYGLFSIHAVFVASATSGVPRRDDSTDGSAQAHPTAFALYREGKFALRGILPSKHSYKRARSACTAAAPACDFIVLLVNDELYGGLGDEIAIISASATSGALALRHELGHNFADIGEEYDAGGDYSGDNFAVSNRVCRADEVAEVVRRGGGVKRRVWPCIHRVWARWLTDDPLPPPSGDNDERLVVQTEPSELVLAAWPMVQLDEAAPTHTIEFETTTDWGAAGWYSLSISIAGAPADESLEIDLDGAPLAFRGTGDVDRHFHDSLVPGGLKPGRHVLRFRRADAAGGGVGDGDLATRWPVICSVMGHQYGEGYHFESGYVGAFPVFSDGGRRLGFRPTDHRCLMRDMTSASFCPVCREAIWRAMLARSKLVRTVNAERRPADGHVEVTAVTAAELGGELSLTWRREGDNGDDWIAGARMRLPAERVAGCWTVVATLATPEIATAANAEQTTRLALWAEGGALGAEVLDAEAPCPVVVSSSSFTPQQQQQQRERTKKTVAVATATAEEADGGDKNTGGGRPTRLREEANENTPVPILCIAVGVVAILTCACRTHASRKSRRRRA